MNDAPQESQPFRHVGTVLADSLLRGGGVGGQECFDALGLREQIGRVTQLRCLRGNPLLELEKVFVTKEV